MMGTLSFDLDDVVTKTTAGLIVLPRDHYLIERNALARGDAPHRQIGLRPVQLLHRVLSALPARVRGGASQGDAQPRLHAHGRRQVERMGQLCCACGLCTLYACPEDLYPKEACDQAKVDLRAAGIKFVQTKPVEVHPMKEYRRVPLSMLRKRLKVDEYEADAPFEAVDLSRRPFASYGPARGTPASRWSQEGDSLRTGELVGRCRRANSARMFTRASTAASRQ